MWADNPKLRAIAERFGRFSPDIRFLRAKRVVGGNDEIVDVEFGDNLSRILPQELMLLTSDDEVFELDFLAATPTRSCFSSPPSARSTPGAGRSSASWTARTA